IGLFIISSEFKWAQRLLRFVRVNVEKWTHWVMAQRLWVRWTIGALTALFVAVVVWCVFKLIGLPDWVPNLEIFELLTLRCDRRRTFAASRRSSGRECGETGQAAHVLLPVAAGQRFLGEDLIQRGTGVDDVDIAVIEAVDERDETQRHALVLDRRHVLPPVRLDAVAYPPIAGGMDGGQVGKQLGEVVPGHDPVELVSGRGQFAFGQRPCRGAERTVAVVLTIDAVDLELIGQSLDLPQEVLSG